MNNIESQIARLRNEEEPYVGMPLRGIRDYDCYKCPRPEHKKPQYRRPEYKEPQYRKPEYKEPEYTRPECVQSVCDAVDVCPIAMAYVPWQRWCKTYAPAEGHRRGTIFPELDLPWVGGGAL